MRALRALLLVVPLVAACRAASEPLTLDSEDEKVNYSVGYQIGGDFKRQGVPLRADALVAGIRDALEGGQPRLPEEEQRATLVELKRRIVATEQASRQAQGEKNLAAARAFLERNRTREGVTTLPSGLQYKVLKEGTGPKPSTTDVVTVHYRGTLLDGTEFDSSYGRNQPATFPLNRVIKGWTEALQLMGRGAKWELYIPPELAYGERGAGAMIPPQSALVFEVELLDVKAE
jgi:FKBP-type peptidyl-prolyl cis-trans isomerase FklB